MPVLLTIRNRAGRRPLAALVFAVAFVAATAGLGAQAPSPTPAPTGAAAPASLDVILKAVASYNGGIDSEALWQLRDYVDARKDDPAGRAECEAKLLQFLKSKTTPVAKMAAARHLRIIAGEGAVPSLRALLQDPSTLDPAIYVLHAIPGRAVDAALLEALPAAKGPARSAVIAALGGRAAAEAVPVLAPLLGDANVAATAAVALGAIGNEAAAEVLVSALAGAPPRLKPVVAASIARCAEQALAARNQAASRRLYEALLADPYLPVSLRRAAVSGRIGAAGADAASLLVGYLEGSDAEAQAAALARVPDVIAPEAIGSIGRLLPRLPEESQLQLVAILAGYPPAGVRPTVVEAARTGPPAVRLAAMKALESVGDQSVIPFLVETAATARGSEQAAARAAIGAVPGRAVDEAISSLLGATPADDVAGELLMAVADRRIFAAKSQVSALLASPAGRVRVQALKTLRVIGTPSDIPAVLGMLLSTADESERAEAESSTAALARKIGEPTGRSAALRTRLAREKDVEPRVRIIGVLPLIGDDSALPVLRAALEDPEADVYDAAVRALAAWPTVTAREDVLALARDARNETHRLLAIRGLVRIVGLDRYRDPKAAVADLRLAAGFSWRPEERILILGALTQFPCDEALELATGFLREPSLRAEAEAAIAKLKARASREAGGR